MKKTDTPVVDAAVASAPAPVIPPPPGGGRWRWDGEKWDSTDPAPAAAGDQPSIQSVTE